MDKKFIYVFSAKNAKEMIKSGYRLLKTDKRNNIFVFENTPQIKFNLNISVIYSDTLTF